MNESGGRSPNDAIYIKEENKMLTWTEKWRLRRLQKGLIRMENMQAKLKEWIKRDRKEAKKLMIKDVDSELAKLPK